MRREFPISLVLLLGLCCGSAQRPAETASATVGNSSAVRPPVRYAGPGVTAPQLISFNAVVTPPEHCKKIDGAATLFVVVDGTGSPSEFFFIHPIGNDLDKMALEIVAADRFKAGAFEGVPASVAVEDEMKLQACLEERKDSSGKKVYSLDLKSAPEQNLTVRPGPLQESSPISARVLPVSHTPPSDGVYRVGGPVSAPRPLNRVEANFSDKGRREHISGLSLFGLIVDVHGMPEAITVVKSLEPSMDQNAIAAVSRYRFMPAMRYGEPVPVRITVEVNFKLY